MYCTISESAQTSTTHGHTTPLNWFALDAIEIFVKGVEQERHQLLRVLLLVRGEARLDFADQLSHVARRH